jgi:plasmid stability protein
MARITVTLDDDTYDQLKSDAAVHPARSVEAEAAHRIKRCIEVNRSRRNLFLNPTQRQALELLVGVSISDADDLLKRIKNLSCVKVGLIERPLSDGESIRLREQASFHGQTPDQFLKMVLDEQINRAMDRF